MIPADDIYSMTKSGFHEAMRQAKEEAWDAGWDTFASFDSRPGGPYPVNPYKATQ